MHGCNSLTCMFYDDCYHAVDGHEKENECEGLTGRCPPCQPIKHSRKICIVQDGDGLTLVIVRDRGRGSSRSVSAMCFTSEDELKEVEIAINRYFANKK